MKTVLLLGAIGFLVIALAGDGAVHDSAHGLLVEAAPVIAEIWGLFTDVLGWLGQAAEDAGRWVVSLL